MLEDNPSVQSVMARTLASLNFRVETASDFDDAVRFLDTNPLPALFLIDIVLPGGKCGVDFAKRVIEVCPSAKIILMSGFPGNNMVLSDIRGRQPVLLRKPIDRTELSEAIGRELYGGAP